MSSMTQGWRRLGTTGGLVAHAYTRDDRPAAVPAMGDHLEKRSLMPRYLVGLLAVGLAVTAGWYARAGDVVMAGIALVACLGFLIAAGSSRAAHDPSRPWRGAARAGEGGWDELRRELDRARRFNRSFSVVRIDGCEGAPEHVLQGVSQLLRICDRAWASGGEVYVLMPETSPDAAISALARFSTADARFEVRAVSFPADGSTSEALLDQLVAKDGAHARRSSSHGVTDIITDG